MYLYNSKYKVEKDGTVTNIKLNKVLKTNLNGNGYLRVWLNLENSIIGATIHRLVASEYCPNKRNCNLIHHIDGDKYNNNSYNLLWVTKEEHLLLHKYLRAMKKASSEELWEVYCSNRELYEELVAQINLANTTEKGV